MTMQLYGPWLFCKLFGPDMSQVYLAGEKVVYQESMLRQFPRCSEQAVVGQVRVLVPEGKNGRRFDAYQRGVFADEAGCKSRIFLSTIFLASRTNPLESQVRPLSSCSGITTS